MREMPVLQDPTVEDLELVPVALYTLISCASHV